MGQATIYTWYAVFGKGWSAELIGSPSAPCRATHEVNNNTCAILIKDDHSITINELVNILQILPCCILNLIVFCCWCTLAVVHSRIIPTNPHENTFAQMISSETILPEHICLEAICPKTLTRRKKLGMSNVSITIAYNR